MPTIEQLQQKRDQLNAQLAAAKARQDHAERKRHTRRMILLGGAVLASLRDGQPGPQPVPGQTAEQVLADWLSSQLNRASDRQVWGL